MKARITPKQSFFISLTQTHVSFRFGEISQKYYSETNEINFTKYAPRLISADINPKQGAIFISKQFEQLYYVPAQYIFFSCRFSEISPKFCRKNISFAGTLAATGNTSLSVPHCFVSSTYFGETNLLAILFRRKQLYFAISFWRNLVSAKYFLSGRTVTIASSTAEVSGPRKGRNRNVL